MISSDVQSAGTLGRYTCTVAAAVVAAVAVAVVVAVVAVVVSGSATLKRDI